ncbi:hypothetical protein [Rhizobium sp. AB2/73]|uniref:hypothetical protein n=1 Tax=Rhizobium sp. AB2/73 TaxID=2795216 RepID=UPI001C5DE7CC|nr:hypothetical protein [Rhizobium sp. AB2/73]QYA17549.1 hypothetical protein J5284_34565 [Rhizobium sp. AB2/73]UEQ85866.1 hypothetical protein I8E17_34785 [Rhizobium sp. AB2/73]
MRLYRALEHLKAGHFRSMEPWPEGAPQELALHVQAHARAIAEFTFSFRNPDEADDTLQTFIDFSNQLWDARIAPIPYDKFWISFEHQLNDITLQMGVLCERNLSDKGDIVSLSVRSMFETKKHDGLVFLNMVGHKAMGDHRHILISGAENDSTAGLSDIGFEVTAALIGALATPQAIRREEPAPSKLNKHRIRKGREPIGGTIVIDVRASGRYANSKRGEGSYSVPAHWRRGHTRTLQDGRVIPIAPTWVNVEPGVLPPAPSYLAKL